MSVAFSPASGALFGGTSGLPGAAAPPTTGVTRLSAGGSGGPPTAASGGPVASGSSMTQYLAHSAAGAQPPRGTSAAALSPSSTRSQRSASSAWNRSSATTDGSPAAADATLAHIDATVRRLLDAGAPLRFEAAEAATANTTASAQPASLALQQQQQQPTGSASSSSAAPAAPPVGTASHADVIDRPEAMLLNFAENASCRDLLIQSLSPEDKQTLKDLQSSWRSVSQARTRTGHAVLFLCLQIGGDPPENPRISPRAKLEAWVDPADEQTKLLTKGTESVVDALEQQYRLLHRDVIFRKYMESSVDDARTALQHMRRKAADGRMLVHYNGHGMPAATALGEVWFYDARHEHFVPFNIADMAACAESPTVYVLDCNSAGSVVTCWQQAYAHQRPKDYFLCSCSDGEVLPANPILPADFFTACLTTPLRAALLWYAHYSDRQPLLPVVQSPLYDQIPGDETNRRTPKGELAYILAAVTDTVAWCTVPTRQFYLLFRQDTILRSLLRNYLLADRLMREAGCTPVSWPRMPSHAHLQPAWHAWDVALEGVLCQIPALQRNAKQPYAPSSYWRDMLTSFEVWLVAGDMAAVPEQLPCVVLALSEPSYRTRALVLLARYFEGGTQAVHNTLACGVLGYVVKYLQRPEVTLLLLVLWLHIVRANPDVGCAELIRANAERQFVDVLSMGEQAVEVCVVNSTLDDLPGPEPYELHPNAAASAAHAAAAATSAATMASSGNNYGSSPHPASYSVTSPNVSMSGYPTVGHSPALNASASAAASPASATPQMPMPSTAQSNAQSRPASKLQVFATPGLTLDGARTVAAFLVCTLLNAGGERTAVSCWNTGLVNTAAGLLASEDLAVRSWGCLLLGRLAELLPQCRSMLLLTMARRRGLFTSLLSTRHPRVRASAVFLLTKLLVQDLSQFDAEDQSRAVYMVKTIIHELIPHLNGVSSEVRTEVAFAACEYVHAYRHIDPEFKLEALASPEFAAREYVSLVTHQVGRVVESRLAAAPGSGAYERTALGEYHFQTEDIPLPPPANKKAPAPPDPIGVVPPAKVAEMRPLLYDCGVILSRAMHTADVKVRTGSTAAYELLKSKRRPLSARIAREGRKLALALDSEAQLAVSENERCRARRNEDLMRQSVLRTEETLNVLTAQQTAPAAAGGGAAATAAAPQNSSAALGAGQPSGPSSRDIARSNSSFTRGAASGTTATGTASAPPGGASSGSFSSPAGSPTGLTVAPLPQTFAPHTLPMLNGAHEHVEPTAVAFRELEPHIFSVDARGTLALTSYERLQKPVVIETVSLANNVRGTIRSIHVVNDLADAPITLSVSSTGDVAMHRGFLTGLPITSAITFTATGGAPLPSNAAVTSAYRPRDGVLFFGGVPSEIRCVSLPEEIATQTLSVPGDAAVTALFCTPTELYAGRADGTVRVFDTRQNPSYLTLASVFGDMAAQAPGAARTTPAGGARGYSDATVLGIGRCDTRADEIIVATPSSIKVYDVRRKRQCLRSIDFGSGTTRIAGFDTSAHVPLCAAVMKDGIVEMLTSKGTSAVGSGQAVRVRLGSNTADVAAGAPSPSTTARNLGRDTAAATSAAAHLPAVALHDHKPIACIGRSFVVLATDASRLASSLAI